MRKVGSDWWKTACAVLVLGVSIPQVVPGQTFTKLVDFDRNIGARPGASLIQGTDGYLYGTTIGDGTYSGNAFKMTTSGAVTNLYSFCVLVFCSDGAYPYGGLVQGTDGNFYGTTESGGDHYYYGEVFKIAAAGGNLTKLYSFCSDPNCTDGEFPYGGLVLGLDGNFYGTTAEGGEGGYGTVFKIDATGTIKTLHNFNSGDGADALTSLVQAIDGNLYGTTDVGGACIPSGNGCGTFFKITPGGALTRLHVFDSKDGAFPNAVIQASDGSFYGTTVQGGAYDYGTVFKITTTGVLTTLHSFDQIDGAFPGAGLVQATDGNFYGTTSRGGINYYYGTIFKMTPDGSLTTLHSFDATDGRNPEAALFQATNGVLYGTTYNGGSSSACVNGCGTVFSLTLSVAPFVETLPAFGEPGAPISILGTNLTGATAVKFNGTSAGFTVVSRSLITTTVPLGATSGPVQVTLRSGTLSSNVAFRVR